jgi:hypothetical protein
LTERQGAAFQEVEMTAFGELGGLAQSAGKERPRGRRDTGEQGGEMIHR